jgi:hypothetical protein
MARGAMSASLTPTCCANACRLGDIGKGAVTVIAVKGAVRRPRTRKVAKEPATCELFGRPDLR